MPRPEAELTAAIDQLKTDLDKAKAKFVELNTAAETEMAKGKTADKAALKKIQEELDGVEVTFLRKQKQIGSFTTEVTTVGSATVDTKFQELSNAQYVDATAATKVEVDDASRALIAKIEAFLQKAEPMTNERVGELVEGLRGIENPTVEQQLIIALYERLTTGGVPAPTGPEAPPPAVKTQKEIDDEKKAEDAAHKKELQAAKKELKWGGSWESRQKTLLNPDLRENLGVELKGLLELFSVKADQLPTSAKLLRARKQAILPILILAKELGIISGDLPEAVNEKDEDGDEMHKVAADNLKAELNVPDKFFGVVGKIESQRMKVLKFWLLQHKQQLLDVAELQAVKPVEPVPGSNGTQTPENNPSPPENFEAKNKAALKTAHAEAEAIFAGATDEGDKIAALNIPAPERKKLVDEAYTRFESALAANPVELKIEADDKAKIAALILASDSTTKFKPDAGAYAKTATEIRTLIDRIKA